MAGLIHWETDMKKAIVRATAEQKPILLDFFDSGCIGCQQMNAVTYPDTNVVGFSENELIPLKIAADSEPLATEFTLRWTPTLIVLDTNGKEHSRTIGFIPPEEFIPTILLGITKTYLDSLQFDLAITCLERIITDYPQSFAAPEAIFYRAVCGYRAIRDAGGLKRAYERLAKEYPSSEWAKRALPYRLVP